ncbi:hypothetical protein SAMD00023353_2301340 [Rosellinia necatrix]|uniref:EGF-like domain-containing protein n=1 Tax=Rosellinia necatrix TaxID=77044 RepID=A0A1W2TGC6_ROSNE|nr:hypothetical protein SAMD00023353_2301340 [Rosellinia necatrix]
MGESSRMGGSVKRAREQAQDHILRGLPPSMADSSTVARRPQAPAGLQTKDGTIGIAISRPTQVPQWPLAGPLASPASADSGSYRPPPGRSQPPQRPPRPSRVPSILDSSRVQDPTPTFQYTPQSTDASDFSTPETPITVSSRPSTLSSVGSIPDFPLPVAAPNIPPRRSVNLGPPPSSRRGASSFYSTASFVSPIPEESPRIKSHTSYASSAAIPESFGNLSPSSQYDPYFDEAIVEESILSDDADESRLVRSASIGKRGKPSLVNTKPVDKSLSVPQRPTPRPIQGSPFAGGTGYIDGSSSSSTQNTIKKVRGSALTADTILNAFESAGATDPSTVARAVPQLKPSRLSGMRRPPRLDIDAVRAAEARGSLTSLPDLIRRATRLASLMDRGKRPASRFDDIDFPDEIYGGDTEKNDIYELEKHQSGLSDMLAAFPPPASRRSMRQSASSWPLPRRASRVPVRVVGPAGVGSSEEPKKKRRCCGLPLWGFLLVIFLIIAIIVAAVVVPVQLLVNKDNAQPAQDCTQQLPCANGGTSVVSQGVCSCICSNGFVGKTCTTPAAQGCTTTTLETEDATRITNVTIGQAIPRLVLDAQANFSIPLSAASILSKFSSAELSCNAENALVTFDGPLLRTQVGQGENVDLGDDGSPALGAAAGDATNNEITLTLLPGIDATITLDVPIGTGHVFITTLTISRSTTTSSTTASQTGYPTIDPPSTSTTPSITSSATRQTSSTRSSTPTMSTSTAPTAQPTGSFTVTDRVLDFARVGILFVLQEKSVDQASSAQNILQTFFNGIDSDITTDQARNVSIGNSNSIDLVDLFINVGAGKIGGGNSNNDNNNNENI